MLKQLRSRLPVALSLRNPAARSILSIWAHLAKLVPQKLLVRMYRYPRVTASLRRIMNASINATLPDGIQEVTVVVGPLRGHRLLLNLKSEEKRMWLNTWEPWVRDALCAHLRFGLSAWDVGAYVGYFSLLMRQLCGQGYVLAVEPDPINRVRLKKNLELNAAADVVLSPLAVTERVQLVRLKHVEREPMQSSVTPEGDIEVPATTLDRLLDQYGPPALIKLDIEGEEARALRGARRLLYEVRPVWVLELHGTAGADALRNLESAGYRIRSSMRERGNVRSSEDRVHVVAEPFAKP